MFPGKPEATKDKDWLSYTYQGQVSPCLRVESLLLGSDDEILAYARN